MTYPYAVKYNGKWYKPGENVPDETISANVETVEASVIEPVITQVEEVQPETVVEDEPKRRGRRRKEY